jgi:hypothetical protein
MSARRNVGWALWRWPVVMAVLSFVGLLSALLGEGGAWWWLSWTALAIPLVVIALGIGRARRW